MRSRTTQQGTYFVPKWATNSMAVKFRRSSTTCALWTTSINVTTRPKPPSNAAARMANHHLPLVEPLNFLSMSFEYPSQSKWRAETKSSCVVTCQFWNVKLSWLQIHRTEARMKIFDTHSDKHGQRLRSNYATGDTRGNWERVVWVSVTQISVQNQWKDARLGY